MSLISILSCIAGFCQETKPIKVNPEMEQKIKEKIEKEVPSMRQKLQEDKTNIIHVEFMLDTFRIERFMTNYITIDYSDFGMRDAAYETAYLYDSLLNKYYKKLLIILKGDDKKTLVQAQRAWIAFRDSEMELIGVISKDEYSGGGTIQQLTESSEYLNIVRNRAVAIFNHYTRASQGE